MAIVSVRAVACVGVSAALFAASVVPAAKAQDGETVTYSYDALGRLTNAKHQCPGRQVDTEIKYDAAGNRTSYTTTGAPGCGARRFVVVPLNGFTIIPIS